MNTEMRYPFFVRVASGHQTTANTADAEGAAKYAAAKFGSPVVLVVRADEPFHRNPGLLRRFVDWVES